MAVREVDHNELEYLIGIHYKAKVPLYVWGATGIGKSDSVRKKASELAKENKREYVEWNKMTKEQKHEYAESPEKYFVLMDIRLSQMDPSDLRGLPSLNGKDVCEWKVPFWEDVISKEGSKGIVFFDEINIAPPSIQSAAYQLILDRALGEISIADGIVCLAAGNRIEDRANVFDLPLPLQNRFTHVTLKPPLVVRNQPMIGWTGWAMNNNVDPRIITFIQARPQLLNPKVEKNSNDRAFATPRSWGKYCSELIKDIDTRELDTLEMLSSVAVGYAAASEFTAFLKFQRDIDFDAILKNPKKAGDITELDLKYSLLSLMAEWYDKNHSKDNLDKLFQIANNITDEFAILMLRMAKIRHPHSFMNNALKLKSWDEISQRYGKYLIT